MRALVPVVVVLLVACSGPGEVEAGTTTVRIDAKPRAFVVEAEVADEPAEHARGLMHRKHLPADAGMLFIFDEQVVHTFWMKNTLIPLDLLSIRDGRVVEITTMQPCRVEDCPETQTPVIDAALELNAGTAKRAGIAPGALVDSPVLP